MQRELQSPEQQFVGRLAKFPVAQVLEGLVGADSIQVALERLEMAFVGCIRVEAVVPNSCLERVIQEICRVRLMLNQLTESIGEVVIFGQWPSRACDEEFQRTFDRQMRDRDSVHNLHGCDLADEVRLNRLVLQDSNHIPDRVLDNRLFDVN